MEYQKLNKKKIDRVKFIDWYFEDSIDFQNFFMQHTIKQDLKDSGEFIINTQTLLDTCGYIPGNILIPEEDYENEYSPNECIIV